jgi:hypothetical protein
MEFTYLNIVFRVNFGKINFEDPKKKNFNKESISYFSPNSVKYRSTRSRNRIELETVSRITN